MSVTRFIARVVQERGGDIRFIRALEEGTPCWFYLRIAPDKLPEYERRLKEGNMNIRDYGEILQSDWGVYPPPDVVAYMREAYDVDTPTEDEDLNGQ